MKTLLILSLPALLLFSCCFGSRKCLPDLNSARFRIISSANGQDMVFGPSKIYNKNLIKFYSLDGADTIFHHYGAGSNPNPGGDSLLFVDFDYRKKDIVYVALNNSDIDTLVLNYTIVDASPCCQDYSKVQPASYNNLLLQTVYEGITIIRK